MRLCRRVMISKELKIELAADIASYVVEQSYLDYPYVTQPNGDVTYTEEAQDEFNRHYDVVYNLLDEGTA